jgi:hypothetical protein
MLASIRRGGQGCAGPDHGHRQVVVDMGMCASLKYRPITWRRPRATDPQRRVRPYAQEVTVTVTEAPNPRPVDGCVVQPWRV